jgi:hypothetical protein
MDPRDTESKPLESPLSIGHQIPEVLDESNVWDRISNRNNKANLGVGQGQIPASDPLAGIEGQVPGSLTGIVSPEDIEDVIRRQKLVKEVLGLCDEVDSKILDVTSLLETQTKNFNFQVDISNDSPAKKAVRKIFKKNLNYIDKKMYLEAARRLAALQKQFIKDEISGEEEKE